MKRVFHTAAMLSTSTLLLMGMAPLAVAEETFSSAQLDVMAGSCANCHGTDGRLSGSVPPIAGRPATLLESRLLGFKNDEVADTTIMNRIAAGFSDDELAALAKHFSNIDPQ
ncbi:c-type cytochrome [Billgrantia endophytica]|uniref:Cytochrome c, class I n=1 Tax=Billgrantia endophytica TaxID=2033802 RepID=A0A2N7TYK4_9GAMM|nr:c-type cytochrome [Halomonas endophytica]PMR73261.1 cytochrome c, class I [Halomonas endophytica]